MAITNTTGYNRVTPSAEKQIALYDLNTENGYGMYEDEVDRTGYFESDTLETVPFGYGFRTKSIRPNLHSQSITRDYDKTVEWRRGESWVEVVFQANDSANPNFQVDSPVRVHIELDKQMNGLVSDEELKTVLGLAVSCLFDKDGHFIGGGILKGERKPGANI